MLPDVLAKLVLSNVGFAAIITVVAVLVVYGGDRIIWTIAFGLIFLGTFLYGSAMSGDLRSRVFFRLWFILFATLAIMTATAIVRVVGTAGAELGATGQWLQRLIEALARDGDTDTDDLEDFDDWLRGNE